MGHRMNFVASVMIGRKLSDSFVEKWKEKLFFDSSNNFVSAKTEHKDVFFDALFEDVQKEIAEAYKHFGHGVTRRCDFAFLHECGGLTKVVVTESEIKFIESCDVKKMDYFGHSYCYGCTDMD